jgi:preprotein translocase subunit SecG
MNAVRGFLHDWRLVLLIIHVGVTAAMIVVILLQRSEGGGLGMGRTDALFSVRGQANVLSRMTAIFAGIFFFLSLLMAWSLSGPARSSTSIMDNLPAGTTAPVVPPGTAPTGTAPSGTPPQGSVPGAAPAAPATPAAPNR